MANAAPNIRRVCRVCGISPLRTGNRVGICQQNQVCKNSYVRAFKQGDFIELPAKPAPAPERALTPCAVCGTPTASKYGVCDGRSAVPSPKCHVEYERRRRREHRPGREHKPSYRCLGCGDQRYGQTARNYVCDSKCRKLARRLNSVIENLAA